MSDSPKLSVVVAIGQAGLAYVSQWVEFSEQSAEDEAFEVILVHGALSPMPDETSVLKCVSCSNGATIPQLRAAGLQAARAPIVALTESFCRPAPGWARALLEARESTDALAIGGPITREGGSASDWALTLVEYGRFMRAEPSGPVDDLALTNVSYHKQRLIEVLGDGVHDLAETHVNSDLLTAGEQLWRAPRALMFDDNLCKLWSSFRALFHHGRLYGGRRVEGSPISIRLFRFAASPLVPLVQLRRIAGEASAAGLGSRVLWCLPQLSILLIAFSMGEGLASLLGPGKSAEHWS